LRKFECNLAPSYVQAYERATSAELLAWFEQRGFFNFIPYAIANSDDGPNAQEWADGRANFLELFPLIVPEPLAVLVLGNRLAYEGKALELLARFGFGEQRIEVMKGHAAKVSNVNGFASMNRFLAKLKAAQAVGRAGLA